MGVRFDGGGVIGVKSIVLYLITAVLLNGCGGEVDRTSGNELSSGASAVLVQRTQAGDCLVGTTPPADQHVVTGWKAAPSDALITHPIGGLTVRQAFAPLWGGEVIRLRLTNRYSALPVTVEDVFLGLEEAPGSANVTAGSACRLTFDGQRRVVIEPGSFVETDWVQYPVAPFRRLSVSFYAPTLTPQLTRHLSANEVLYLSLPGNHAGELAGDMFMAAPEGYTANFLILEALEVQAPTKVATLVAVGDSITDGSDSTTGFLRGGRSPMVSTDQRYPDHLQRRILQAGLPLAVANAGIGGNELLSAGYLPQFGPALLDRLDADVLATAGVSHVLLMIGTNDFGNPELGAPPTSEDMIAGYQEVVTRVHEAGLKIVLGTIPPAEGTVTEGLPAVGGITGFLPLLHGSAQARRGRDEVNDWIRTQTLSDGVMDFAKCLEDPARPGYLAPEFNSGDNLHPNSTGYAAMAACVDLGLFGL